MRMKKVLFKSFSVLMAIILLVAQGQILSAKTIETALPNVDETVFSLDENQLNSVMQDLTNLENYVVQNNGVTYDLLASTSNDLIKNVDNSSTPMGMANDSGSPLGISAFLWGCVLGWVGLLLVYIITNNDKPQVKKALTGCLVGTGIYIVFYVIYAAVLVDSSTL
jgi:hypothetical protein